MIYSMLSISTKKLLDSLESPIITTIDKNDIFLSKVIDDSLIDSQGYMHSSSGIHIDLHDYKLVLAEGEIAYIFNVKSCRDSINKIAQDIVSSMKLYNSSKKIMGVLIHFKINEDFSLIDISEAMEYFHDYANEDASVVFSATCKEDFLLEDVEISTVMVA